MRAAYRVRGSLEEQRFGHKKVPPVKGTPSPSGEIKLHQPQFFCEAIPLALVLEVLVLVRFLRYFVGFHTPTLVDLQLLVKSIRDFPRKT